MKKIAYTLPRDLIHQLDGVNVVLAAGHVFIVSPCYMAFPTKTEAQVLSIVAAKDIPADALNVTIIDSTDMPATREHRKAWEIKSNKVSVNAIKAAEIDSERAISGL